MTDRKVVGLPVAEPERYLSRAQLAEFTGLHVNTIDRYVAQGMPSERWGLRVRRFRPSLALAWMREQEARKRDDAAEIPSEEAA